MKVLRELPRLLHVRSQYGYTSRPSESMSGEPEAVPPDYQAQLTRRATQTARDRMAQDARELHDELLAVLDRHSDRQFDRQAASTVRAIQRLVTRLH